jgi:murein L,D-transpeptidase YcbB/YkuD
MTQTAPKTGTFPVTQLNKPAHCDFHSNVLSLITATGAEVLHLENLMPMYESAINVEKSTINRATAFVSTPAMDEADDLRDKLLSCINAVVNAQQYSPLANKKRIYNKMHAVIAPYKGIRDHEYAAQTQEVDALLRELTAEGMEENLQALGIAGEVEELALANAKFAVEMNQKMAENAARQPIKDIDSEEARKSCDDLYHQICELVNAYALIQPTDEITSFITSLNGVIATYSSIAAQTGKSKKEEEPTPETENGEVKTENGE